MSAAPSNLLSLLRLLDDTLPADDAARVRDRLTDDAEFADQYGLMLRAMRPAANVDALLVHADDVEPCDVAEFVEGRMTEERRASFEAECWSSESVLREVIATWNAAREAAMSEYQAEPNGRARSTARGLLATIAPSKPLPRARPLPPPVQVKRQGGSRLLPAGSTGQANGTPMVTSVKSALAGGSEEGVNNVGLVLRPARRNARRRFNGGLELWIALTAVAAAVLALTILIVSPLGRERTAGSGAGRSPVDRPREDNPAFVRDGSRPSDTDSVNPRQREVGPPNDPDADSLASDGGAPEVRQPPREPRGPRPVAPAPLVQNNTPPGTNPRRPGPQNPGRTVPNPPLTPPSSNRPVTLVAWSDVQGVAADKEAGSAMWSGIHSRSASELWHSNVRSELLTLPHSRVSGILAAGPRIIADADSLVEIAAAATGSPPRSPTGRATAGNADSLTTPLIAVRRGRLAIDGLQSGQRIRVQLDARTIDVEATLDDSTFAIERVAGETVVAAYHGRVRAGEQEFHRRAWGRVIATGELAEFRPQRAIDWYQGPGNSQGLPSELCQAFNNATDIVRVAAQFEAGPDPTASAFAAKVALRCLASESQPISPALLRRLTNSGQELHRQALIEWLVTRYRQSVTIGEADLQVIGTTLQIAPRTTSAMSGWFQSAIAGQPPATAQLTELVTSLRDTSVFTRQCAKYFLQYILNDPLLEFDPSAPTNRAAISSVTRKLRDWQMANQ